MANTANLDLVKPAGTDHALVSVLNQNSDKIDAFAGKTNAAMASVQDGIAIVADGDTHAAIASGQFVYVKNHSTLAEGLYRATAAIATDAALSTSNLAVDASGGMNALKSDIDTLNSKIISEAKTGTMAVVSTANNRFEIDVQKPGYTPIGVISTYIYVYSTTIINISDFFISQGKAYVDFRSNQDSASATVSITVLYIAV